MTRRRLGGRVVAAALLAALATSAAAQIAVRGEQVHTMDGPEIRDGALWSNERPGFGIDLDESLAAKYPFPEHPLNGAWPPVRQPDGTVIRP